MGFLPRDQRIRRMFAPLPKKLNGQWRFLWVRVVQQYQQRSDGTWGWVSIRWYEPYNGGG